MSLQILNMPHENAIARVLFLNHAEKVGKTISVSEGIFGNVEDFEYVGPFFLHTDDLQGISDGVSVSLKEL